MLLHILKVLQRPLQIAAIDGLSGLVSALERDAEVGTAAAGGFGGFDWVASVTDLVFRLSAWRFDRIGGLEDWSEDLLRERRTIFAEYVCGGGSEGLEKR